MLWNQKRKKMSRLELFKKMMSKAKANGYKGDDYEFNMGYILEGTNYYSVIFRNDFATALWGDSMNAAGHLHELINAAEENKWKYLEENVPFSIR